MLSTLGLAALAVLVATLVLAGAAVGAVHGAAPLAMLRAGRTKTK